jgi:hypothetical protein
MNLATEVPTRTHLAGRRTILLRALTIALPCAAFLYAALFALQVIVSPPDGFDESITVLAARAVEAGKTPHGDFWVSYPALNYWLLAAAFKVFGSSYIVARCVALGFYVLTLVVVWMVAPDWRSRTIITSGLIVSIGSFYCYAPWSAFALLLIALLLLCWKRTDRFSGFWLLIGGLLAATLLMRINFGIYGLIAVSGYILVDTDLSHREKLANLAWVCTPMVLAVLAYCIICRHCLPALYAQVIYFPTHALMRERILLIRSLATGLLALPFLLPISRMWSDRGRAFGLVAVLVVLVSLVCLDLSNRDYIPRPAYALAFAVLWIVVQVVFRRLDAEEFTVLLCYLLLLHYYLARADLWHLWPAFIVLSLLILQKSIQWPIPHGARIDLVVLVMTGALGLYLYHGRLLLPNLSVYRYAELRLSPQGRRNLWIQLNFSRDGEVAALSYLTAKTNPDEYVYSGLLDHARGYTNNLRAYVILGRPIPVSDWEYEPGYSSEAPSQELAISELERTRTKWLLLWHGERNANEISRSRQGSSLLDSYIRLTFCPVKMFDDYQVWYRCNWSPFLSRN